MTTVIRLLSSGGGAEQGPTPSRPPMSLELCRTPSLQPALSSSRLGLPFDNACSAQYAQAVGVMAQLHAQTFENLRCRCQSA